MYNIGFMARKTFLDFSAGMYKQYKKEFDADSKGVFIVMDASEVEEARAVLSETADVTIVAIAPFMNEHWDEFTLEKLSYYEKKYDASPMWRYIYSDRFLIYRDYDYVVHTTAGLFAFWEYVFTTYQLDFYYDEVVATLLTYVAYLVGKKLGTHYYSMLLMRSVGMDLTHHYILNDPYEMIYNMPADYLTRDYSLAQLKMAEDYLKGFEKKHSKPQFMQLSGKVPHLKPSFFILPLFYLRQRFFNPNTRDKGNYIYYKAYEHTCDPIRFYFRYRKSLKYYHKADLTKKFVYFPLHLQPEASTIVCAQKYEKQLYFLDNLAKSLPADTLIYAKEHYSFLGSRPESFYKALQEYPNIVVIDPWEDSFALIEKAQAVATLTGTAGQEAMMLRRPVIMGGDILYSNAPGVMKVEDIYDNYLDIMASYRQPSREDILKYLAAYMSCAREGNTYVLSPDRNSPENCSKVAKSMYDYFRECKPV